jgi:hypothetical protein
LAYICDSIPGAIVQNISGHTDKIMMEYMINAGVFKSKAAQERDLVEGLPSMHFEGAPHEESRE